MDIKYSLNWTIFFFFLNCSVPYLHNLYVCFEMRKDHMLGDFENHKKVHFHEVKLIVEIKDRS